MAASSRPPAMACWLNLPASNPAASHRHLHALADQPPWHAVAVAVDLDRTIGPYPADAQGSLKIIRFTKYARKSARHFSSPPCPVADPDKPKGRNRTEFVTGDLSWLLPHLRADDTDLVPFLAGIAGPAFDLAPADYWQGRPEWPLPAAGPGLWRRIRDFRAPHGCRRCGHRSC